jgi:hypothetical protein
LAHSFSALIENLRQRPCIFLAGLIVIIWLGILVSFRVYGYDATWRLWQIPTLRPDFLDFRIITGSAETVRLGLDPRVKNPGDPYGRLFNLPEAWSLFFKTGLSQDDTVWISILSIALFFIGAISFPGKLSVQSAVAMSLVLFSPAAMLLYERGNVDLFMLTLVIVALLVVGSNWVIALLLVFIGAVFKYYPILSLSVFLREPKRKFLVIFWSACLLFAIYVVFSSESFSAAWEVTEYGTAISYGVNVLASNLGPGLERSLSFLTGGNLLNLVLPVIPYAYVVVLLFLVLRLCVRGGLDLQILDERNGNAFRAGSAIFICTFLLGSNWDYRLTFLVLTVPQLVMWIQTSCGKIRTVPMLALTGILLSCWYMFFAQYATSSQTTTAKRILYVADELVNWGTFLMLAALFSASSPDWLKELTARVVGLKGSFPDSQK